MKDRELIVLLNQKLETEPEYPLPDGFTKVKETKPVVTYEVPASTAMVIGEARTVSVTVLDDLCNELFGLHILEPKVRLEERMRVKLQFARPLTKNESETVEIIRKVDDE